MTPANPIFRLLNAGFDLFILMAFINGVANYVSGTVKYSYWVMAALIVVFWLLRSAANKLWGGALLPLVGKTKVRPTWIQALLRNTWILLAVIPYVGLPLMVVTGLALFASMYLRGDRRGWHDLWAGTAVARA